MVFGWRTFVEPDDAEVLIALMQRMEPWNEGGVGWLHPGDVVWRAYQNLSATPEEEMRIISDEAGKAVALVEMLAPEGYFVHMPADAGDLAEVLRFAVEEAERELRAREPEEGEEPPSQFETEVLTPQAQAAEILRGLGFTPAGEPNYRLNGQPLGDDLPAPDLRDGAIIRAVRDEPADFEARVDLHRDVWTGSKLDLAGYERLRTKPLYRPDLDLVVETAEGELAAYCIVWWDPVTKMGEFEPVGTAERFRGRGYGKAILREGMRRIRALGGEYATVLNSMDDKFEPSRFLYASAGFTTIGTFDRYTRPAGTGQDSPR
jgi:ribosomal protein S18 acetylase RimI-like enzyme